MLPHCCIDQTSFAFNSSLYFEWRIQIKTKKRIMRVDHHKYIRYINNTRYVPPPFNIFPHFLYHHGGMKEDILTWTMECLPNLQKSLLIKGRYIRRDFPGSMAGTYWNNWQARVLISVQHVCTSAMLLDRASLCFHLWLFHIMCALI